MNLAYLPMTYLSGLFFPMPESIRSIVLVSPAFHLNQLALQAAGVSGIMPVRGTWAPSPASRSCLPAWRRAAS